MALVNKSNRIFLTIGGGKVVQSYGVGPDTPGAVKRERADGKVVYEIRYDSVSGVIKDVRTKDDEFNGKKIKKLVVVLADGGEEYQIETNISSRYAKSLLFALPNVDLTRPVIISPWYKEVDGRAKMSVYIKQGEEDIPWHFGKRDNPNGLPELKEVVFKGEKTWDDYDQIVFLTKYIETDLRKKLDEARGSTQTVAESEDAAPVPDGEDDLPF